MAFSQEAHKGNTFLLFAAPLLLFALAATAIYPYFQYQVVSDDISYLAITQRYLRGDYAGAVNGYWSPLNIWLLALLVKLSGWKLLFAAYVLNCLSFAGILLLGIKLCLKFTSDRFELTCFGLVSSLFWAANIPVTHFADALNCCLLLACLQLLLRSDFLARKVLWIVYGLLCAIAYFSKAYSFYILPLSTAVILWQRLRQANQFSLKRWLAILLTLTCCMALFSFPWIYQLHQKYGRWMISSAGAINTNWFLSGTIYFSKDYPVIVPPSQPGGLSCWEDPWINHGPLLSPFGSTSLIARQALRIAMNVLGWFKTIAEFSPLYFLVWVLGLLYLIRQRFQATDINRSAIILAFLVFPVGYLTLSVGTRYLWFTVPLVMISGLPFFRQYLLPAVGRRLYHLFLLLYFVSWLPGAVSGLKDMLYGGRDDKEVAALLQDLNIKGSFVTADYEGYQHYFRISWFSGNPFYMHFGDNWDSDTLLREAQRLGVKYYFYTYKGSGGDYQLQDANGKFFPEMTNGKIKGLKVFQIN